MNKMKLKESLLTIMILLFCILVHASDRAVLVHNSRQDIEACEGKLKLKLVRVWGGDEEEDENKFFKSPQSVVMDKQGLVYISDGHNHCIKVFEHSGKYLRTIGRRGRGPGDLYCPSFMVLYPDGDLVVSEGGGFRIQRFNPEGKSKKIIKTDGYVSWLGVTSQNQLAIHEHYRSFRFRKLIYIQDNSGKTIREIGTYHDKSKNYMSSESLAIAMDDDDNFYVANRNTPVIRKYSPDGAILMAITFEPPVEIPVKVSLNDRGDEIKKVGEWGTEEYTKTVSGSGNSHSIAIQRKGKGRKLLLGKYIAVGHGKRVYIVTTKRVRTLDEIKKGPMVMSSTKSYKVLNREKGKNQKIDYLRILVFDPTGKVIAETPLTTFCEGMYLNGNRLFIMDSFVNQCILEYEIQIED